MNANLLRPHTVLAHPTNDRACGVVPTQVVIKREPFDHAETECVDSPCARLCPHPSIWRLRAGPQGRLWVFAEVGSTITFPNSP